MNSFTVRSIAHDVNTGARSAERVAQDTLERAAAYDTIQPEAWIIRLPAEQVLERARLVEAVSLLKLRAGALAQAIDDRGTRRRECNEGA